MLDSELDVLVNVQSSIDILWSRLKKVRAGDVVLLCKLRHRMETEDGFIPGSEITLWLNKLVKETE